jgi:hypothetical protein
MRISLGNQGIFTVSPRGAVVRAAPLFHSKVIREWTKGTSRAKGTLEPDDPNQSSENQIANILRDYYCLLISTTVDESNYDKIRRIRMEMSARAGHDIRRLIALINEDREAYADRIINPGGVAERLESESRPEGPMIS